MVNLQEKKNTSEQTKHVVWAEIEFLVCFYLRKGLIKDTKHFIFTDLFRAHETTFS